MHPHCRGTMAVLWCAILLSSLSVVSCSVQCRSSTGQPVDWFMVYKVPELRGSQPPFSLGTGHYYMDVNSPVWTMSTVSMNDTDQAVGYTLQAIYKMSQTSDFMYALYNDEDPNKYEPRSAGHSKGVVAFDKSSGFWLIHSTPRFPSFIKNGYFWPHNGLRNGQSFLCVSYKYSQLNQVAKQLLTNSVYLYDSSVPPSFQSDNSYLAKLMSHDPPESSVSKMNLLSIQGTQFLSFAKSSAFGADLYSDLVAPSLGASLLTETWQDGSGKLRSNCTGQYKVCNVISISLPNNIKFPESKDHSKWAITMTNGGWVCIGDINRQKHQEVRGGGTTCLQNQAVWNSFFKSISDYERCPTK